MSVHIHHILGASWNVTVFKTDSDVLGKDSDRQNVKSVSAEEITIYIRGDICRCWGRRQPSRRKCHLGGARKDG